MERLTEWNGGQTRHAYYPRCFKEPCYGSGCKIKDCPFETAVCERLAAYEDTGLEPEAVETVKLALAAKHLVDLETLNNTPISRLVELAEADKDGRVRIMPESQNETCGNCDNFKRESGTRHGLCAKRPHPRNRYGKIDRSRKFIVYQNTQSCKFYTPLCLCAERAMEGKKDGNETSM
jgi:hypothetical protein